MQPQAETIFGEILARLNRAQDSARAPNEFEVAQLEHEARKLLKIDATHGYIALAAICALKYDIDGLYENAKRATQISYLDPEIWMNYAVSLSAVFKLQESADALVKAAELAPLNGKYLRAAIQDTLVVCQISRSLDLISQWKKRFPDIRIEFEDTLISIKKFFDTYKVEETDVQGIVSVALQLLSDKKQRPGGIENRLMELSILEDEEVEVLHCNICVMSTIDEVVDLSIELADVLSSLSFPVTTTSKFVITFESSREDTDGTTRVSSVC